MTNKTLHNIQAKLNQLSTICPQLPENEQWGSVLADLQALAHQQNRQEVLLQITAAISDAASSIFEIEELLEVAVNLIRDYFDFYFVGVYLSDELAEWAKLWAGTGEAGRAMRENMLPLKITAANHLVTWCIFQRQPRIVLNAGPDTVYFKSPYLPEAHSEIVLPLIYRGQVIGALDIQSSAEAAFGPDDITLMQPLADQLANFIQNVQLLNENARLLTTAENNRRFLKTVIEHIPDPIFIKDKNHILREMNQANARVIGQPEEALLGKTDFDFFASELAEKFYLRDEEIFATNQILEAEDTTVWGDGQPHTAYTRLIPIPNAAGESEYLLGITHDVTESQARAAERERLLNETAALYQGSRTLASAFSERQIFEALFAQIRQYHPCEIAAFRFHLVDGEPTWAELRANWHKDNSPTYPVGTRLYLPDTAQIQLLTSRQPIFIDDIATDGRLAAAERASFVPTGACSVAVLPLYATGQALGAVLVYFTSPFCFTDQVQRLWLAITDQAGVALVNRQLIQEATYRAVLMEAAAEVARAGSSILELQELLNASVNLIRDRFQLYYVGVFLADENHEWALLKAGTGEEGLIQLQKKHRLKIGGESMIGWSIEHRQPRIALDVGKEAVRFQNPDLPKTRSEMALPLIYHHEVIGALTIQSQEQAAFSQDDILVLQTMANQLANAVKNAQLFMRAQQEIGERKRAEAALEQANAELERRVEERTAELRQVNERLLAEAAERTRAEENLRKAYDELDLRVQERTNELSKVNQSLKEQITERERSEALLTGQQYIFEMIANGLPLTVILTTLAKFIEAYIRDAFCSILLMDKNGLSLRRGVAPSLPESFLAVVDGLVIGPQAGSCGTAAYRREQIISVDIAHDPLWVDYADWIIAEYGLRACWSTPILATDGQVLGTFALYYTEPRCPNEADLESISASVYLASIALERTQVEEEQRESERRLELALRGADLGLWDVNLQTGADKVDKRAAEMLGYSLTEVETHLDWWDKRTHPDDLSRVQQAWDAHVQGKTPLYECEYRLRTKLDDWKWILDRGKVVEWDSNGQPLRLAGTHQDITKRKETEESLHQALQRTQLLYNISEALATLINQQAAFETVLGEYLLLLNVDRGGIMILDPAGEYNRVQALYIDNKVVESNLVFPAQDDLVARHLVDYPFAMVVADVSTHPLTSHNHHIRGSVEAMLLVPIIVRGHTVGILGADATQKGHVFTQDEMELGEAIADQLAIWLENHRLLAEAEYRFELLQTAADVSRAASSMLDVNELINTLVNLIRDKFDYYYVGLFLIDEAKEWAVLRAGTGEAGRVQLEKRHQLKIGGESMIGWCIQNRQARIALDVGKEAVRFQNPDLPDTHSEMALPLLSRGEVIGALTVQSTQRGAFSKEDITVLQTMADHLANGLENARLFEKTVLVQQETKKLLQEQTALREAASAISSTLDLQAVLTQLAVQMGQAIDATSVYIGSYDQVTQTSTVLAEYVGPQAGAPEHVSDLGQTYDIRTYLPSLGEFLRKGYHSYHFDDAGLDQPGQDYLQQFGVQSELHVPLRIRGQLIAIATVWESRYRREFTADEISLCQGIAQQAAIAIENARLHTETQQRLKDTQALQGFSHKLAGTLQLDQILATFFETCASVLGFDYALFCLVDKYQHRVKVVDGFGVSESHKKRANYGLDSHDIMADIVKTGKTEVITGWDDRFDKALFETEGHSNWLRIFTPITLRQEHIGLVEAGFNKNIKNKITDPQIRLLRAFIDQTALAIDNAQRYQASQKAAKREALIKEITTKVRASTNLDTILQITAKEVGDALGSKRTYVHVISSSNGDTSKKMKRELP